MLNKSLNYQKYLNSALTNFADFDRAKIVTYEEVHRMPPFTRRLLVLVGAGGVGRRTLKNMLVTRFPKRFGSTIPCEHVELYRQ